MLIGSKFKEQRIKLKLSQAELSAGICTQAVISKIENQNISPSVDILSQLVVKLNLTLNDVFSEFTNLPSNNLVNDKILEIDQLIQNQQFENIPSLIDSINPKNLSNATQAHIHYQLGRIAANQSDFDESIFQYNYVLQLLDNRKKSFWKFVALIGLGKIYQAKAASDKVDYYFGLASQNFESQHFQSDSTYWYSLESLTLLATFYTQSNDWQTARKWIDLGLVPRNGALSAQFTDRLYYLSALNTLNDNLTDRSTLSHDLTMAIAFADYNHNQALLDEINQLMQQNNIRELKIKP
ncbi:helix-turn-helix domain-containing protein [Companilactobacillus sp.]|jgi:transcriptional regulator with XRE-family HTH domain|uniref:helix-turn-helix domain-containing protein n=1 Tax=Companilactobacillus sp. TaxID=2767905 RepID=UPI0025C0DBB2|nr:helix-turn-helix transcriptional regulator [Companilactobacillus sp.]MCH4008231.1 helix-turn-helix domain-containing protein [Companilactobacillus sp.]MCH4051590.1 helix-turn-helix domain-containing protein [Companilactobacillus sp.]MCH4076174.1 helix-turn-helix domain-containing protein [Companilactobacillus sp.]MCH4124749.1 helix-turn-helix domain-containing protein [Companilactobacillus sp.]MCH4131291.1 helix-turn-helix domain-containing protein [Companilactobacillus sp.]